jgi:hypothetical protein
MPAIEPLCLVIGICSKKFSKQEKNLLEADLYTHVCAQLKEIYRQQLKDYFYFAKFTKNQEDAMLEEKFVQNILKDILLSNQYDPKGIAIYTNIPEDVIMELILGINTHPSSIYFRKIIELDRVVRPELYQKIGQQIVKEIVANTTVNEATT